MPEPFVEFDVYMVPDKVHARESSCPSCASPEIPELVEELGGQGQPYLYGDLMQCVECRDFHIIVEFPYLESPVPIRTRFRVPEHFVDAQTKLPKP